MKHSIALLAIFSIILTLITPTPAHAWPFHHRKSAHVTQSFVTLSSQPNATITLQFASPSGKVTVAHADHNGHIALNLPPGFYDVSCFTGGDLLWRGQFAFVAGDDDLLDALIPGTFKDLTKRTTHTPHFSGEVTR